MCDWMQVRVSLSVLRLVCEYMKVWFSQSACVGQGARMGGWCASALKCVCISLSASRLACYMVHAYSR